jgi:phosphoglycerate dehydrogenase-like enzyme
VIVTFAPDPQMRDVIGAALDRISEVAHLGEVAERQRKEALAWADAVLAGILGDELRPEELAHLGSAGLIQLALAGVDQVPFDQIPAAVPVASNAGAYGEPMSPGGRSRGDRSRSPRGDRC